MQQMRQSNMSVLGKTISIKGELRALDDLTLEGHVDGPVFCEQGSVMIASSAEVRGDIIARDITVLGHFAGQLIATDVVDVRTAATVTAQVFAARFILDDGASFNGRVHPDQLETALRVAKYQQRKRDSTTAQA
jgi:cytoskeletal protein CcmA (bactofilin family)